MTKKAGKTKPESNWGINLLAFQQRHNLSQRQLSKALGDTSAGFSQRTIGRLVRNETIPGFLEKYRDKAIEKLRCYLAGQGLSASEIHSELFKIFQEEITVIVPKVCLSNDAVRFFGLRHDPFYLDPESASEVFTTDKLNSIEASVLDAILYQKFIAVLGKVGTGKSLMKTRVIDHVEQSDGKIKLIWPEFRQMDEVNAAGIITLVLEQLGLTPKQERMRRDLQLKNHLGGMRDRGIRVAIGFDECHRLNDKVITALKNFLEYGNGGFKKYLGIVLFGQLSFRDRMFDPRMQEIAERIQIIEMPSLGSKAWDYVIHRVKLAGGDATKLFDKAVVDSAAKQSDTPLAIGNLLNGALMRAFEEKEQKVRLAFLQQSFGNPSVRAVR